MRRGSGKAWWLESIVCISCLGWAQTRLKSAQVARHGYDAICAHNLFAVYHIDKLPTDNRTPFYNGKMCECTQISYKKCDDVSEYSYENVNDVYFDTNISINMRMKVNVMFIFICIELRIVYLYHVYCYLHHLCAWWCRCICIWICKCRWI